MLCCDDETVTFFICFYVVQSILTLEEFKGGFEGFSVKPSKIWFSKTGNQTGNHTENDLHREGFYIQFQMPIRLSFNFPVNKNLT